MTKLFAYLSNSVWKLKNERVTACPLFQRGKSHQFHFFVLKKQQQLSFKSYPATLWPISCVRNRAFTLLELMIVIAILAVLAAIAVPQYQSFRERAVYSKMFQTMRMMEREIDSFNIANSRFPETLAEAGLSYLMDPWGNPYQYLNIQTTKGKGKMRKDHNLVPINTDYDLYSMGPDGKSVSPLTAKASRDDIIRANDGAYLGRVSDY